MFIDNQRDELEEASKAMKKDVNKMFKTLQNMARDSDMSIEDISEILDLPEGSVDLILELVSFCKHCVEREAARDAVIMEIHEKICG